MSEERQRVFLALELGSGTRALLEAEAGRLAKLDPDLRVVADANLHLTLAFLGELEPERVRGLEDALDGWSPPTAPFELALAGLGAFPSARRARVLWAGVAAPEPVLALERGLRGLLEARAIALEDRSFHPHVTLARRRARGAAGAALVAHLEAHAAAPLASERVTELVLMESRLEPGGARYRVRTRVPLGRHGA